MTATAPENQPSYSRKRRRGTTIEEHPPIAATSLQPLRKRAKRPHQSRQEVNTAYWDSISKLWLTRRALKELNRRNRQTVGPKGKRSLYRLDLGGEPATWRDDQPHLQRFARHGGPDLRDLMGVSLLQVIPYSLLILALQYPEPFSANSTAYVMPLENSTAKTTTSKSKKSSTYDHNFKQNLIDNGIYPDDYDFPDNCDPPRPSNEDEILNRLGQPRPSLSPSKFSEEAFRTFKQTNSRALNEDDVMGNVFPVIQGSARIPSAKNINFGNLKPLTDGNFVDAKPDCYDGAHPALIDRRIRAELSSSILPSTQQHAPALPNFFTEVKGPEGSGAVAQRQACYDGAIGARGIHEIRSFRQEDPEKVYDDNAYTISSTYHSASGTLELYTTYPPKPTDHESSPEYYDSTRRLGFDWLSGDVSTGY